MRFNVKEMISAIDAVIAADLARWEERREQLEQERAEEREVWREKYGQAWVTALRKASAKLRKGLPLEQADFPYDQHRYLATYRTSVRDLPAFRVDPDLLGLQRVLRTVADEQVTSAGLKELGVTSATLRRVVLAMAPKTITSGR